MRKQLCSHKLGEIYKEKSTQRIDFVKYVPGVKGTQRRSVSCALQSCNYTYTHTKFKSQITSETEV